MITTLQFQQQMACKNRRQQVQASHISIHVLYMDMSLPKHITTPSNQCNPNELLKNMHLALYKNIENIIIYHANNLKFCHEWFTMCSQLNRYVQITDSKHAANLTRRFKRTTRIPVQDRHVIRGGYNFFLWQGIFRTFNYFFQTYSSNVLPY